VALAEGDDGRLHAAIVARLRAVGCVFAEEEAQLLLDQAGTRDALETLVQRRLGGEPLEVVLGWVDFCGLRIGIEPGVFVPRQGTRLLVEEAAALARPGDVLVDLCCGSGAVGLAVVERVARLRLYAADVDPAAVRCAEHNLAGRGQVFAGDLFAALPAALRGRIDLLTCNAPYVPTAAISLMPPEARLHEPPVALDGGSDGLDVHRRVAADAVHWLVPGGHLLVELGERQVPAALRMFASCGLAARVVSSDEVDAHVVVATRARTASPLASGSSAPGSHRS
jgi:release factor glutamine methyltransferase